MKLISLLAASLSASTAIATSLDLEPVPRRQSQTGCPYTLANPKGQMVMCGDRGKLASPKPWGTPSEVDSLSDCIDTCFKDNNCQSFGYNSKAGTCQMFTALLINQKFKKSKTSNTAYYNRRCYRQKCQADLSCNNQGIQFAVYPNDDGDNLDIFYSSLYPEGYGSITPDYKNTTSVIGGIDIDGDPNQISVYGTPYKFNPEYFVLNHRGYFFAAMTGSYTITLSEADDIAFFWIGPLAYEGWKRSNAAMISWYNRPAQTYSFSMTANNYYPFRIMYANGQANARFGISILDPAGAVVVDSHTLASPQVVQFACNRDLAPEFSPFGAERSGL